MFEGAGFKVNTYPYYDAATGGLKFDAMLAALRGLPAKSIVLLHACCHNPTGVDLTPAQWEQLIPVLRERELLPYLDLAYQGYGAGIVEDAFAVRALAGAGVVFFIANSFSKSMSLYGERAGALSVVCADAAEAELVLGQLKATVRRNYSSPTMRHAPWMCAAVMLAGAWSAALRAETLVPVVDFFRLPQVADISLSPSGRYLAIESRREQGTAQLSVTDLDHPDDTRIVAGLR